MRILQKKANKKAPGINPTQPLVSGEQYDLATVLALCPREHALTSPYEMEAVLERKGGGELFQTTSRKQFQHQLAAI